MSMLHGIVSTSILLRCELSRHAPAERPAALPRDASLEDPSAADPDADGWHGRCMK